jgi:hypothetical protein
MSVAVIRLDQHRELFKNDAAIHRLAELFRSIFEKNETPLVMFEDGVVFTAVSPNAMKSLLYERLGRAVAKDPEFVTRLQARIESDPIVD